MVFHRKTTVFSFGKLFLGKKFPASPNFYTVSKLSDLEMSSSAGNQMLYQTGGATVWYSAQKNGKERYLAIVVCYSSTAKLSKMDCTEGFSWRNCTPAERNIFLEAWVVAVLAYLSER